MLKIATVPHRVSSTRGDSWYHRKIFTVKRDRRFRENIEEHELDHCKAGTRQYKRNGSTHETKSVRNDSVFTQQSVKF